MALNSLFGGIYHNKTVLVTGDTGFKGSWLVHWLLKMNAKVVGCSLEPATQPNHFSLLKNNYTSVRANINNLEALQQVFHTHQPDMVFHLAAQSLVRYSYTNPIETFQTNILGTVHLLELCKQTPSVKAVVNITSDKCYDNQEWIWGYRENDPMGGHDPYSASKGCAELVTAAYQKSFFNQGSQLLASARAGNVIGGGDWAQDRLIPDIVQAAAVQKSVVIRQPLATRPWQHVLDPLSGYLTLGWYLLEGQQAFAQGWNFGPGLNSNVTVKTLVDKACEFWKDIAYQTNPDSANYHEANLLMLDCSKANKLLKWTPVWEFEETVGRTIQWYQQFYKDQKLNTEDDLMAYISAAKAKAMPWTL